MNSLEGYFSCLNNNPIWIIILLSHFQRKLSTWISASLENDYDPIHSSPKWDPFSSPGAVAVTCKHLWVGPLRVSELPSLLYLEDRWTTSLDPGLIPPTAWSPTLCPLRRCRGIQVSISPNLRELFTGIYLVQILSMGVWLWICWSECTRNIFLDSEVF